MTESREELIQALVAARADGSPAMLDAVLAHPGAVLSELENAPCPTCEGRGGDEIGAPAVINEWSACSACGGSGILGRDGVLRAMASDRERYLERENDELHDDVVTALRVRDLALEEAATEMQPGPDGQDYIDRARMIARWLTAAHARNDEGEESGHKAWVETELALAVSVPEPSEGG